MFLNSRQLRILFFLVITSVTSLNVSAENSQAQSTQQSAEINVLWPFFPGGISEFRYLIPLVNPSERDGHGDLVLGLYSDFASRRVRDEAYGKVVLYALKLGYRHYFKAGWHVEATTNVGWREETNRPGALDKNIEGIAARLWTMVGYQWDLSKQFYANTRLGVGSHLYRSDSYEETEKKTVLGFDFNVGVRF